MHTESDHRVNNTSSHYQTRLLPKLNKLMGGQDSHEDLPKTPKLYCHDDEKRPTKNDKEYSWMEKDIKNLHLNSPNTFE